MRPKIPSPTLRSPTSRRRQGATLVLVLAALALISFIALAILTLVRSEDRSSKTAAQLTELRLMAELPEKIVISQIRRATKGLGTSYTWASQPGMIRVFGVGGSNGKRPEAEEFYKLYSAPVMTLGTGGNPLYDGETFQEWAQQPGMFTDLNEPVQVQPTRKQGQAQRYDEPTFIFPILDPGAVDLFDGFEVPSDRYDPNPKNPKLPMPVGWLYVLKNGKLAAPMPGGEGKTRVPDATKDNPIIGRIAFWTDDEGCKLNLNTATEPAPWDAPHTRTTTDEAYAQAIPAKGEYYRMPSHPAYTSLAPVLRHFGKTPGNEEEMPVERQDPFTDGTTWWRHLQDYHRLLPATIDTRNSQDGTQGGSQAASDQVELKQERFFTSVDEFFFNTEREANGELSSGLRFKQEDVRKAQFFLTTHSRAPELNPFNRPKLSLWPVQQGSSTRNEVDKAMVKAATLGDDIYYFQRASEWTGVGSPGSSQNSDEDMAVDRNEPLFGYLLDLSERDVPGFGGRFVDLASPASGKYSPESRDQLLTSMFDMIRWGINPASPYNQTINPPLNPQYTYLAPGYGQTGADLGEAGWTATPMRVKDVGEEVDSADLPAGQTEQPKAWAKGYGRYPTITEVAMVFAATDADTDADGLKDSTPANGFGDRTKGLVAFLVIEPWLPAPGPPSVSPAYEVRIENLSSMRLDGQGTGLTFPQNSASNIVTFSPTREPAGLTGHPLGGGQSSYAGFGSQFLTPDGTPKPLTQPTPQSDATKEWLLCSNEVFLTGTDGAEGSKFNFSSGVLKISILDARTAAVVQTLHVQFPECELPMPLVAEVDASKVLNIPFTTQLKARFTPTADNAAGAPAQMTQLFLRGDVVRALEVFGEPARVYPPPGGAVAKPPRLGITRGDMRLMAGRVIAKEPQKFNSVDSSWFAPHPLYFESILALPNGAPPAPDSAFKAHSLRDGAVMFTPQPGGQPTVVTAGRLVGRGSGSDIKTLEPLFDPSAKLGSIPATPPGTHGAFNLDDRPGDFDNGLGITEDGPYIGIPDFNNGVNQSTARPQSTSPTTSGWFERGGVFAEEDGVTFMPLRQAASGFIFGSLPTGVYGRGGDPVPRPWETLLLCANPASRLTSPDTEPEWSATDSTKKDHFGFKSPRDHLWLEFFRMPLTEPASFGDMVSTEGKVNMNYQMLPFVWIKRATAMHGALRGVRMTAIPSTAVGTNSGDQHYKKPDGDPSSLQFRYGVNAEETLKGFDELRFDKGDVFRSPSEICDMWMVPERLTGHNYSAGGVSPAQPPTDYKDMLDWWEGPDKAKADDGFEATGDNLREAPYSQVYPRLSTKSNVFTVHYRVQLLNKSRSTKTDEFDESRDSVVAEHRGQTTIERYIDLNQEKIPDFVTTVNEGEALDDYYSIRILNRRDFKP